MDKLVVVHIWEKKEKFSWAVEDTIVFETILEAIEYLRSIGYGDPETNYNTNGIVKLIHTKLSRIARISMADYKRPSIDVKETIHITASDLIDMFKTSAFESDGIRTIKLDMNSILEDDKRVCYCKGYKIILE